MKRIIFKLGFLAILGCGLLLIEENKTQAKAFSCIDTMFSEMENCDESFDTAVSNEQNEAYLCDYNAQLDCQGLTGPSYASCYTTSIANCVTNTDDTYNDRYDTYESCLDAADDINCHEQPDFCTAARDRADACAGLIEYDDLAIAYTACRNASGVNQCQ